MTLNGGKLKDKNFDKIRESAEEILESFAEISEGLPSQEETYYEQDTLSVLRSDGKPSSKKDLEEFRKNFLKNMPDRDEEGNLKVEVAEWAK